ncbi:MAG: orotate phosphoribosyltransferase [Patescibacteria group bacterium]|nr:orotate phosphoribosyltransferase [Patescibacteria group bacterium]
MFEQNEPDIPVGEALIELMMKKSVLKFGEFTLKSGRISPYFANFGFFNTGDSLGKLGELYARKVIELFAGNFDVIFGPAYKGIPLATHTAMAFSRSGADCPWAFNRKEAKDHGEGGSIVGADIRGKRVLIVDDVITAGTAIGEAVEIIRQAGGTPMGVLVAFDRMEKGKESDFSAVQESRKKYGIPVVAIATLDDLFAYLEKIPAESGDDETGELIERMKDYRAQYGADYSDTPS